MKKKLITIILLCTISLSMLGCNDDKQKQASNDNNKPSQSTSNDNKNDKQGGDDATVNKTYTELPKENEKEDNSQTAPKEMTAEEKVAKFNELYPKMETFFKEKLEKPYISRGDEYKVKTIKGNIDVKGFKGICGLDFTPNQRNDKEFDNAAFTIAADPDNPKKIYSVGGSLSQFYKAEEVKKHGYKLKGTLFEEFINLLATDKIDIEKLEKEASKDWMNGGSIRNGHTDVSVSINAGDVRVAVMIY